MRTIVAEIKSHVGDIQILNLSAPERLLSDFDSQDDLGWPLLKPPRGDDARASTKMDDGHLPTNGSLSNRCRKTRGKGSEERQKQ